MLTKTDLDAIGKLIDKKLSTDISAIQARIANIENNLVRKSDLMHLEVLIRSVERRVASVEGKLLKTTSKDDLKKSFRSMEKRLMKSINRLTDTADSRLTQAEERIDKLNQHMDHPPVTAS